jgi:biopolymer transport protein ExbB/TolQ
MRKKVFLRWLLLMIGLINLVVVICVLGLHTAILSTGVGTAIVSIIIGLFILTSFKSGVDSFQLSTLVDNIKRTEKKLTKDLTEAEKKETLIQKADADKELINGLPYFEHGVLVNKFVAGLSMGLGMIGTVCGLIMMFSGIDQNIDPSNYQANIQLLKVVSAGFGVALYTTLVGLASSVLLSIQGFNVELEVKKNEQ